MECIVSRLLCFVAALLVATLNRGTGPTTQKRGLQGTIFKHFLISGETSGIERGISTLLRKKPYSRVLLKQEFGVI